MAKSVKSESLFIEGPAGRLEAIWDHPAEDTADGQTVAIVCHPHPAHGGAMTNKVAHTLARAMTLSGWQAIRFNFRGVGESDGHYDEGRGELLDALAVVQWAEAQFPGAKLVLAGFSFGAAIALQASHQVNAERLVLIAPPVGRILDPSWKIPEMVDALIVQGGQDEIVDAEQVVDWANGQPEGLDFIMMEEAGHFFHGALVALRQLVVDEMGQQ
ncbi:MAG: alpha/beta hydrolase [Woeseiaceae bacterium]